MIGVPVTACRSAVRRGDRSRPGPAKEMKMKKRHRLTLPRETIRVLTALDHHAAQGGVISGAPCTGDTSFKKTDCFSCQTDCTDAR